VHEWVVKLITGEPNDRKSDNLRLLEYALKSDDGQVGVRKPFTNPPPDDLLSDPTGWLPSSVVNHECSPGEALAGLLCRTDSGATTVEKFVANAGPLTCDRGALMSTVAAEWLGKFSQGTGYPDAPVPDELPANDHPRSDTSGSRARTGADGSVRRVFKTRRRTRDQSAAGEDGRGRIGYERRDTDVGRRRPRRRRDATEKDDVRAPVAEVRNGAGRLRERERRMVRPATRKSPTIVEPTREISKYKPNSPSSEKRPSSKRR